MVLCVINNSIPDKKLTFYYEMTGNDRKLAAGSFSGVISEWTSRELQLARLHEEILARREALLGCSVAYHQSQEIRNRREISNSEQAFHRNDKLLTDITLAQQHLYEDLVKSPSPRFTTLQKNYWAMVKSQVPMWEQDLGIKKSRVHDSGARPKHREKTKKLRKQVNIRP